MSRSAKTNHVMSLVGKEQKKAAKPVQKSLANKPPSIIRETEIKNPALQAIISEQEHNRPSETEEKMQTEEKASLQTQDTPVENKNTPSQKGSRITAIVPELINEELETVVNRFKISPDDGSLWKLTRAALEAIRPEYSHNPEEYDEKCGRLRQKVIMEMTKAAIKLSKEKKDT